MSRCSIIKCENKEILYFDHSNLSPKEILQNMEEANKMMKEYNKPILLLSNFENTSLNKEIMDFLKSDKTKEVMKKVTKSAVLGVKGLKKVFHNTFNKISGTNTRAFTTEEEAKEYLIK